VFYQVVEGLVSKKGLFANMIEGRDH